MSHLDIGVIARAIHYLWLVKADTRYREISGRGRLASQVIGSGSRFGRAFNTTHPLEVKTTHAYPEVLIKPMVRNSRSWVSRRLGPGGGSDAAVGSPGTSHGCCRIPSAGVSGKARPGVAMALRHGTRPDKMVTVSAGGDVEATDRARGHFTGYPPYRRRLASCGMASWLHVERHQIEEPGSVSDRERADSRFR